MLIIDCLREIGGEHALKTLLRYIEQGGEELIIYALLKSFTSPSLSKHILTPEGSPYYETVLRQAKHYLESAHPLVRAEAVALWGMLRREEALDDLLSATKDVDHSESASRQSNIWAA